MNDRELIRQILNREVSNIVGQISPSFRLFAPAISNYVMDYIDPYITAFLDSDGKIMTNAAKQYLKDETNRKIDEYIKKFETDAEKTRESNK